MPQVNATIMQDIWGKLFDNTGRTFFTIILKPRPEVKVKMTQEQYVTLCDPKMYLHTKCFIPT